jgi:hypothetical protein
MSFRRSRFVERHAAPETGAAPRRESRARPSSAVPALWNGPPAECAPGSQEVVLAREHEPQFVERLDPAAILILDHQFAPDSVEREARLTTPPLVRTARKEPNHATCYRRNRWRSIVVFFLDVIIV